MENYIITKLENYRKYFGDILFPDELVARREVGKNPANWMYSFDGRAWEQDPMDIGKIDYSNALFRPKPEGCILGITEDIKKNPELYQYSHDNGNTWEDLLSEQTSGGLNALLLFCCTSYIFQAVFLFCIS